ncbi:MAG TPA: TRAP transporter large permease subunit [Desulfomonilaceae bacterium]|nr:TRAP transporter large permease subunit [Desulfomonilaceae bacterium]
MIATLVVSFFVLLIMGVPIAILLLITTAVTLVAHTSTSLLVLPQQLFNALDNSVLLSIPFFILAGNVMTRGAMARKLIEVVKSLVGSHPGGLALAATLACMFFAALSGSSPATVIAIGSVMIPALIEEGYGEHFSIGLVTSAGSLGIVIPPSIPMILYCMVMNTSVAELFMAGVIPGLLIGGVFICYTVVMAHKNQWRASEKMSKQRIFRTLREGIWGLMLPVIVLGGIYTGMFTPTEASAVSLVYALFVEIFIYREIKLKDVPEVCKQGAILSGCLLFILACSMTLIWLLAAERLPHQMADFITAHVHSGWLFLIYVNILFLLLGTVMDNVSAMLILSPLFVETLKRFGIDYIHYGIIMVLVIEYGFLTPPFGLNLFVAMGLTNKSLVEVSRGVWPFLILLLGCLLLVTFVPSLALFLPKTFLR